jgi:glycosyltransferase involved in cell wall biosynthesis
MLRTADLDVLIPTRDRPEALAVTLSGLAAQTAQGFRVVVSDQSIVPAERTPIVAATLRLLRHAGHEVQTYRHMPPNGMAEQRAYLLEHARGAKVLYLDDDVWLAPQAIDLLRTALTRLGCGFVGFAVQGLSYAEDFRPEELEPYEEWTGQVRPERVRRGTTAWRRHTLHNAANLMHLAERKAFGRTCVPYKVAWIGGCVLFDRAKLEMSGGFDFWSRVPAHHAGEDVVAQLRVMERYGGAGLLPSHAYHLELPTTVVDREAECYDSVLAS